MQLAEKVAVVTGGAAGIGRALALRFAAEGARGVVVADLDQAGAEAVAAEIGEGALAFACDVADPAHADALIGARRERVRPGRPVLRERGRGDRRGPGDDDRVGARARRQPPGARLRGGASSAGLARARRRATSSRPPPRRARSAQIGSAPYAVTKHAAVAFAEWLVGHVRRPRRRRELPVPDGRQHRPAARLRRGGQRRQGRRGTVLGAGRRGRGRRRRPARPRRFLILPHPEVLEFFRRKGADYDRWLAGMRRLQASVAAQRDA